MGVTGESPFIDLHFRTSHFHELLDGTPHLVNLSPGMQAPDILFVTPMLFELYGGGFDKSPGCQVRVH